jgi:hypothetical protein
MVALRRRAQLGSRDREPNRTNEGWVPHVRTPEGPEVLH